MALETERKTQIQRIASLIEKVESCGDPNVRALARELVESVMALHGAGLERILEIAASFGETGKNLIEHCSRDELVSSLLLLYGLHPDNLPTRVERALQRTKPFLESHGAQAELLSISGEAGVRVRLHHQSGGGCGSAAGSLRSTLETAIQDAAPDAMDIVVEEPAAALLGFIPVGNLQNGQPLSASQAGNPVRSKG